MSERLIALCIDAHETSCGNCRFKVPRMLRCEIFGSLLDSSESENDFARHPDCLNAELADLMGARS